MGFYFNQWKKAHNSFHPNWAPIRTQLPYAFHFFSSCLNEDLNPKSYVYRFIHVLIELSSCWHIRCIFISTKHIENSPLLKFTHFSSPLVTTCTAFDLLTHLYMVTCNVKDVRRIATLRLQNIKVQLFSDSYNSLSQNSKL